MSTSNFHAESFVDSLSNSPFTKDFDGLNASALQDVLQVLESRISEVSPHITMSREALPQVMSDHDNVDGIDAKDLQWTRVNSKQRILNFNERHLHALEAQRKKAKTALSKLTS